MQRSVENVLHPEHDRLMEEVRRWYQTPCPEMGYQVERRVFGFYNRNLKASHPGTNQVFVRDLTPESVPVFLAEARSYFQSHPVQIWVEDPDTDAVLGPALLGGGCTAGGTQVYLAHVGEVPLIPSVRGLTLELVTPAILREYAVTHAKGFASSEEEPDSRRIDEFVALRQAEMAGDGRFLLARMKGEPTGIIAWYEGTDRFLFSIATRVPFRGRGIAKALLCHVLADSYGRGYRSIIINADPHDTPIRLYRSLGFVDEVHWRQLYQLVPAARHHPTA